jgi:hypothetical protein
VAQNYLDLDRTYRLPAGYTRRFSLVDEGIYWHLYCGEERINGGLTDEGVRACWESRRCAMAHYWSVPGHRYAPEEAPLRLASGESVEYEPRWGFDWDD